MIFYSPHPPWRFVVLRLLGRWHQSFQDPSSWHPEFLPTFEDKAIENLEHWRITARCHLTQALRHCSSCQSVANCSATHFQYG